MKDKDFFHFFFFFTFDILNRLSNFRCRFNNYKQYNPYNLNAEISHFEILIVVSFEFQSAKHNGKYNRLYKKHES